MPLRRFGKACDVVNVHAISQAYWQPHNRAVARRIQNMGWRADGGLWLLARGGGLYLSKGTGVSYWHIFFIFFFKLCGKSPKYCEMKLLAFLPLPVYFSICMHFDYTTENKYLSC